MENVLVAIDGKHGAWEAISRACSLARRVHVQLSVLLVVPPSARNLSYSEAQLEASVRERLELMLEAIKAKGVCINYFVTEGVYEEEVIAFVQNNRVSLLVYEVNDGDTRGADRDRISLRTIRHRISCRVEVVAPKKHTFNG